MTAKKAVFLFELKSIFSLMRGGLRYGRLVSRGRRTNSGFQKDYQEESKPWNSSKTAKSN